MSDKSFGIRGSSIKFTHPDLSVSSNTRHGGMHSRPQSAQDRLNQHDESISVTPVKSATISIQAPRVKLQRPSSALSSNTEHFTQNHEHRQQQQPQYSSSDQQNLMQYQTAQRNFQSQTHTPMQQHRTGYSPYDTVTSYYNPKVLTTRPIKMREIPTSSIFNRKTSGPSGAARSSMNFIEDTYITNLQQQIQFLEMELDLQKKMAEEQKRDMLQGAAPLDETLDQLRMKFIEKERGYTDRIEELEKKMPELEEQNEKKTKLLIERERSLDLIRKELKEMKQTEIDRRTAALVPLEKDIDDMTHRLQTQQEYYESLLKKNNHLTSEIDTLKEKFHEVTRSERELIAQVKSRDQQIGGLEKQIDQYEKLLEQHRIEREQEQIRREKEIAANSAPELRLQLQEAKQRESQLELEAKKLELEKAQLETAKLKADEISQQYMSKNITLQKQCSKILEEAAQHRDQYQKILQQSEVIQQELSTERRKATKLQDRLHRLEEQRHEDKEKFEEERTEMKMQLFRDKQLRDELDKLEYQREQREKHYSNMDKDNLELRHLARNAQEHNIALTERCVELETKMAEIEQQRIELSAKVEHLQRQISIQDLVRDLRELPLEKLFSSSNNVANVLSNLFEKIDEQDQQQSHSAQRGVQQDSQHLSHKKQQVFDSWLKKENK